MFTLFISAFRSFYQKPLLYMNKYKGTRFYLMHKRTVFCLFTLLLVMAIAFCGCTSPQASPSTLPATPVTVLSTIPTTATPAAVLPEKTAEVTKHETRADVEKVILTTRGLISPTEFKTFDFKSMGDEFSQIGVKYRIMLKADKPVIGYAVTNTQAAELQGNTLTPQYESYSDRIQWGLITPYMNLGRVTDSTKTFTVTTIAPYVFVVDARWMASDNDYKTTKPFNYELTITKITSPS